MNDLAKEYSRFLLQKDEETDFRIRTGTEMYRKENPSGKQSSRYAGKRIRFFSSNRHAVSLE